MIYAINKKNGKQTETNSSIVLQFLDLGHAQDFGDLNRCVSTKPSLTFDSDVTVQHKI